MSNKTDLLGVWIRRFLLEHLVAERNLSRNAQRSYRDAFAQLMPFVSRQGRMAVDRVAFDDLSPDRLRSFLAYLETERQCTMRTRNQRLAAIHAFARFVADRAPDRIAWCSTIRTVPFKRFHRPACVTSISRRSMPSSPLRISRVRPAAVTMRCCCFCITPGTGQRSGRRDAG